MRIQRLYITTEIPGDVRLGESFAEQAQDELLVSVEHVVVLPAGTTGDGRFLHQGGDGGVGVLQEVAAVLPDGCLALDVQGAVARGEQDDLAVLLAAGGGSWRGFGFCPLAAYPCPVSGLDLHAPAGEVLHEGAVGAAHAAANLRLGAAVVEHGADEVGLCVELVAGIGAARLASEFLPHGLAPGEGFLGALGDERAFYLRGQREGEGYHVALQVVAQFEVFLDGDDVHLLVHEHLQDGHHLQQASAEPGDFRGYQGIPLLHAPDERAQFPPVHGLHAGDGLLDVAVYLDLPGAAEVVYLVALVFDRLSVGADTDVCVYHFFYFEYTESRWKSLSLPLPRA